MMNKNLNNKHVEEVAAYLAQHMEFSVDAITKALTKYEMDIEEDICMDNIKNGTIKIYGDVIIFDGTENKYEGIDVSTMQYLNDFQCYCVMNPDWFAV